MSLTILNTQVRKQLSFDMVILDPPSFARSKKICVQCGKKIIRNLLKEAIAITEDHGIIVLLPIAAPLEWANLKDLSTQPLKNQERNTN